MENKNNHKGFVHIVLILIVFVVLAVFGYLLMTDKFNFTSGFERNTDEKIEAMEEDASMEKDPELSESDDEATLEMEIDETDLDFSEIDQELDELDEEALEL